MYWSKGTKTEAYIAAPKDPGTYPLFVICHGGWTTSENKSHVSPSDNWPHTVAEDVKVLDNAWNNAITIGPIYRGYGHSGGTVNGLDGNTIDTENAIKAAMNHFNSKKEKRHVRKGYFYLSGMSMGGGVT